MTTTVGASLAFTLTFAISGRTIVLKGDGAVDGDTLQLGVSSGHRDQSSTPAIAQPFGMTGVVLQELAAAGRVYKLQGATKTELQVRATAAFPGLPGVFLTGRLMLDGATASLALVELSTARPLTLTELIANIVGGLLSFAAAVTDQLAFNRGELYYLPGDASRTYVLDDGAQPQIFLPGYHLEGELLLFGSYPFDVRLGIHDGETSLITTSPRPINAFDFVTLDEPYLEYASTQAQHYLRIRTTVTLLQTPISAEISAEYDLDAGAFVGDLDAHAGGVELDVGLAWSEDDGLTITRIAGLPASPLDLIDALYGLFNPRGAPCEELVEGWLDDLASVDFSPGLDGTPTRSGTGADAEMLVPLKLGYSLSVGDYTVSRAIEFTATFVVPQALDQLPEAIGESILASTPGIAADLLTDPDTYYAIALIAAQRGGASAMARMICRALRFLEDLAKRLADAARTIIAETIAAAVELAAQLIAVALLGVTFIMSLFEALWDEVKKAFGGGDDGKRDEARAAIRSAQSKIETAILQIRERIADVSHRISPKALVTGLDGPAQVVATALWNADEPTSQNTGGQLVCELTYLAGAPGDATGAVLLAVPDAALPDRRPLRDLGGDYQLNAMLQTRLTGFTFMQPNTRAGLVAERDRFADIDDSVAHDFADYLSNVLADFDGYNDDGVRSAPVYATSEVPTRLTIGRSFLGVNSRISVGREPNR